uniref:Protein kinase domain-containing protein n=2 Tax=Macrostomum lignano TaxID=282301 RepID=A0A1I8GU33_9PLAT
PNAQMSEVQLYGVSSVPSVRNSSGAMNAGSPFGFPVTHPLLLVLAQLYRQSDDLRCPTLGALLLHDFQHIAVRASGYVLYDEKWDKVKLLSRGEFGEEVHEVRTDLKNVCAAKTIRLPVTESHQESGDLKNIDRVVKTTQQLCRLRHDNIIRFYEIKHKQSESTVEVLMELITDKTLGEFIGSKCLPEKEARILLKQVCDALRYLHSETPDKPCVIHRQINPSTIVVSADGRRAKLTDFGLAILLVSAKAHHLSVLRGDTHYMAPELFLTKETEETLYSCASDIWAFGCLLYRMTAGKRPHSDCKNMLNIGRRIQNEGAPTLPKECSRVMQDFYTKCTAHDRKDRETAAQLMEHAFIVKVQHFKARPIRGCCLVIAIQQYDEAVQLSTCPGVQEDADRIERVFQSLKFQVERLEDTNSVDIWRALQALGSFSKWQQLDSFVCFIIGCGSNDIIYASDGEEIEIKEIVTSFRASRCPALRGKPKMFFAQTHGADCAESEASSLQLREADFLVCRSVVRQSERTFVQALCDVIEDTHNLAEDVEALIDMANSKALGKLNKISSLNKKLMLHPEPETSLDASPNKWSDEQLSQLCNSLGNQERRFGPLNQTLLMIASAKGKEELVSNLLKQGHRPIIDLVRAQDVQMRTAIACAAIQGHENVLLAFTKAFENNSGNLEAEVNRPDSLGQTPLILAARNHRNSALEQLVQMGSKLNHQDSMEYTAVAYAAMEGFDDTVRILCKLGADPKLPDFLKNTPLIWAARGGHKNVIEALRGHLSCSTDEDHWRAKGEEDMDALEWAKLCGHYQCASFIQEAIRSLASPTGPATTPSSESSGDNDSGGSPPGGAAGGGLSNQSTTRPGGSAGDSPEGPRTGRSTTPPYPISGTRRRLAKIINIVDFVHGCGIQRRDGSMNEMTEHHLYRCFTSLGFEIKQYLNVGSIFFENLLTVDYTEEDYNNADAFLLCIMSHGEQGYIFAYDGVRILLENVFRQFRQCPGLRKKPKIFIVQACRGLESDRFTARQPGQFNNGAHEDCLCVYSTYKRNVSFRDSRRGGYFTRALKDVILTDFDRNSEDLRSAFTKVVDKVASETNTQQIPVYQSTLRQPLRLPPKGVSTTATQSSDRC